MGRGPPYFVPPPYDSLVNPDNVKLPEFGTNQGRPLWQIKALEQVGTGRATEYDLKKTIAVYYGMIAYADMQLNKILNAVINKGLMDNTWIVFGADHGDFMGEKGLFEKAEVPYECLQHVPLIIVPPRHMRASRGTVYNGLVENVDLFPTFLSMAGISVPDYSQGKNLLPHLSSDLPIRDYVFAQVGDYHGYLKNTFPGGTFEAGRRACMVRGVRTREFSYIRDDQCGDEAYDLRQDPKELNNLLNRPGEAESEFLTGLQRELDRWEGECGRLRDELGVIPGDRGFEKDWE